jgi:hypothetical protein
MRDPSRHRDEWRRRRRVPQEEARLETESHYLDGAPGCAFDFRQIGETACKILNESIKPRIGAARRPKLVEKDARRLGLALHLRGSRPGRRRCRCPSQMPFSGASR